MKRIALILPYWGRFPNYFQFYLESVRRNPTIDILLFTDDISGFDLPENVHINLMSFMEFKAKLQSAFDFPITHLQHPYNFCDFKPAYGYCLQEFLKGYDFWGHCDCDLIFGDIRHFFTEALLDRYDRLLTRGHLSLYRNDERTNNAFIDLASDSEMDYHSVFTSSPDKVWAWDEWLGTSLFWQAKRPDRLYDEIVFDDINPDFKHFVATQRRDQDRATGKANFCYQYEDGALTRLYVQDGKCVGAEPICYVHFQKRRLAIATKNFSKFWIVPNRFIDYETATAGTLKYYGHRRIIYLDSFARRSKNFLRKVRNCILRP